MKDVRAVDLREVKEFRPGQLVCGHHLQASQEFLSYHEKPKWTDASVAVVSNNVVVATLRSGRVGDDVVSHPGATFGGLCYKPGLSPVEMEKIVEAIISYYRSQKVKSIEIKPLPLSFRDEMDQTDEFAYESSRFRVVESNVWSVLRRPSQKEPKRFEGWDSSPDRLESVVKSISESGRRHYKQAHDERLVFEELKSAQEFYELLSQCLMIKHGARPHHSESEIGALVSRFRDAWMTRIGLFGVRNESGRLLACCMCMLYVPKVMHVHYIASNEEGDQKNAVTKMLVDVADRYFANGYTELVSLGAVTYHGQTLDREGLYRFKASLSKATVVVRKWKLELR